MNRKDVWMLLTLASAPTLFGISMALEWLPEGGGILGVCIGFVWCGGLWFLWAVWANKTRPRTTLDEGGA